MVKSFHEIRSMCYCFGCGLCVCISEKIGEYIVSLVILTCALMCCLFCLMGLFVGGMFLYSLFRGDGNVSSNNDAFEIILSEEMYQVNTTSSSVDVSATIYVHNGRRNRYVFNVTFSDSSIRNEDYMDQTKMDFHMIVNYKNLSNAWIEVSCLTKKGSKDCGRIRKNIPYGDYSLRSGVHISKDSVCIDVNSTHFNMMLTKSKEVSEYIYNEILIGNCDSNVDWSICKILSISGNVSIISFLCENLTGIYPFEDAYESIFLKEYMFPPHHRNRRGTTKVDLLPLFFEKNYPLINYGSGKVTDLDGELKITFNPSFRVAIDVVFESRPKNQRRGVDPGDIDVDPDGDTKPKFFVYGVRFIGKLELRVKSKIILKTANSYPFPKIVGYGGDDDRFISIQTPITGLAITFSLTVESTGNLDVDSLITINFDASMNQEVEIGATWHKGKSFEIVNTLKPLLSSSDFDVHGKYCKLQVDLIPLKVTLTASVDLFNSRKFGFNNFPSIDLEISLSRTYSQIPSKKCGCSKDDHSYDICQFEESEYWNLKVAFTASAHIFEAKISYGNTLFSSKIKEIFSVCKPNTAVDKCKLCDEGKENKDSKSGKNFCCPVCNGKCYDPTTQKCCKDHHVCPISHFIKCTFTGCCDGVIFNKVCCEGEVCGGKVCCSRKKNMRCVEGICCKIGQNNCQGSCCSGFCTQNEGCIPFGGALGRDRCTNKLVSCGETITEKEIIETGFYPVSVACSSFCCNKNEDKVEVCCGVCDDPFIERECCEEKKCTTKLKSDGTTYSTFCCSDYLEGGLSALRYYSRGYCCDDVENSVDVCYKYSYYDDFSWDKYECCPNKCIYVLNGYKPADPAIPVCCHDDKIQTIYTYDYDGTNTSSTYCCDKGGEGFDSDGTKFFRIDTPCVGGKKCCEYHGKVENGGVVVPDLDHYSSSRIQVCAMDPRFALEGKERDSRNVRIYDHLCCDFWNIREDICCIFGYFGCITPHSKCCKRIVNFYSDPRNCCCEEIIGKSCSFTESDKTIITCTYVKGYSTGHYFKKAHFVCSPLPHNNYTPPGMGY